MSDKVKDANDAEKLVEASESWRWLIKLFYTSNSNFMIIFLIFFLSFSDWFISELTSNPINIVLLLAIFFLLYKIFKSNSGKKISVMLYPIIKHVSTVKDFEIWWCTYCFMLLLNENRDFLQNVLSKFSFSNFSNSEELLKWNILIF